MRKLWQVALGVLALVSFSPSVAQAQSGSYTWLWDDFNQGAVSAGAMGDPAVKWYYAQAGSYTGDDGHSWTWGQGMSVVSPGTNPITGEPAFTATLPPDAELHGGPPGQFDHLKWGIYMNHFSSNAIPGFDAQPGMELACDVWISGRTYGTEFHPFGAAVQDPQSDVRLASYAMNSIDLESGLVFDFLFTNTKAYVVYERLPYAREMGWGNYAAFTYAIPVADISPGTNYHAKIVYDREANVVRWFLDDQLVFRLVGPGRLIDRQYMIMDHGGFEQEVSMRQLNCGMGMFTLLDGYRNPGYWVSQPRGLVRLNSTTPNFYYSPQDGAPSLGFVDEAGQQSSRLFGQGAWMNIYYYQVTNTPKPNTLQLTLSGGVGILDSSSNMTNQITQGPCPGTSWVTASSVGATTTVSNTQLQQANWGCDDPSFYFGSALGQAVPVSSGWQTFNYTPPPHYTCIWAQAWGDVAEQSFNQSGNNCSISTLLEPNQGWVWFWYFVIPS